jgi:hypothetical protein
MNFLQKLSIKAKAIFSDALEWAEEEAHAKTGRAACEGGGASRCVLGDGIGLI